MSGIETVADPAAFEDAIAGDDLVIAKFETRACTVCRQIEPALRQLRDRSEGALRIMAVDAEDYAALAERYEIRGVPTLMLFRRGRELARCNGFQSTRMLREWLAPHTGG